MELDDLKNTWESLSDKIKVNPNFNLKKFDKMNKSKIQSRMKKIIWPEILGSLVCVASIIYIGFNFSKLDSNTFQVVGIVTILLFAILSVSSLMSVLPLYKVADLNKSYAETLKDFATKKRNFCKWQRLNFYLNYLLFVTVIILSTRLFGRSEITDSKYFFIFTFTFGFSFFLIFSTWVTKIYKKSIRTAEDLLKELAN